MNVSHTLRAVAVGCLAVHTSVYGEESGDKRSDRIDEVVVVASHPLSSEGLSQASSVLAGAELERKAAANIGATLAREPGIHSASFGAAVGRPVIHGLGGPRVRVMEDRIDALDVSVTSSDHLVAVEPFIAERVEVLKGSSALLYGPGAIGGVVDVHTNRIPHRVPDQPVSGGIETRFDDANDGNTTSAKLNGGGGRFAWHLDGTFKDGDDYEIPGFAESSRARALEEEEHEEEEGHEEEEEHDEDEEVRGVLPGSEFDSTAFAGGASYVAEWGFIGVSVSRMDAEYGLPGGHAHGHEEEHEEGEEAEGEHEDEVEGVPTLELEQTRVDLELGVQDPFGVFTSLNVRVGVNDYEHQEIEPDGALGTDFENDAWEFRTELVYETDRWQGAFGLQHADREFSAIGDEAFVPPVDTLDTGIFWVGQRSFDGFDLETGARIGRVDHDPEDGRGAQRERKLHNGRSRARIDRTARRRLEAGAARRLFRPRTRC